MSQLTILRKRTIVLAAVTFAIALVVLTYGTLKGGATREAQPAGNDDVAVGSTQTSSDKMEVELITLRPEGFEPSQIIRPQGPFVLVVDDRSGKERSSLSLQQLKGEQLRDIGVTKKKSEWFDVINLPAGDYVLTDAVNPERHCQITLQ